MGKKRKIAIITDKQRGEFKLPVKCDVFSWKDLSLDINLRDYDGLIVDVSNVDLSDANWYVFEEILTPEICIDILGAAEGYIVVLGNPAFEHEYPGQGHRQFMSWSPFKFKWIKGKGESLQLEDAGKNSIYGSYLAKTKTYEYSFSNVTPSSTLADKHDFPGYSILATRSNFIRNRAGYVCAASIWLELSQTTYPYKVIRWLPGSFIMLPVTSEGALKNIISIISIREEAPESKEPEWAAAITVINQAKVDEQINQKQEEITEAKLELNELIKSKKELRSVISLLYESDKPLERSVKAVLKDLGSVVIEPSVTNKIEFYLNFDELRFAPEVKSTQKEHIEQKGLRQAVDWSNDAFDETHEEHKPLLIVSNQFDIPPNDRLANPLEPNLVTYAEARKVCVMTVGALFQAHQLIKGGKLTNREFFDAINACSGFFTLPRPRG
jgi:hypothetical protein